MTEKWEEAEQDYLTGMKYKDIAAKYDVTLNTVKSWKQRYEWSRSGAPPKQKSVHTKGSYVNNSDIKIRINFEKRFNYLTYW
ncbi:hypothetical protein G7084_01430 [Weissella coleopterorum]|uniref:Terminase ATPase subunit N-terminal domain-containing protein n=1 Tax=Weissella coleopterorum TaxID=2714949 RepID=A0A6G8AYF7_9LACO|nr:hypothetical protein G7084_01430 [Weissella coleopterorum]